MKKLMIIYIFLFLLGFSKLCSLDLNNIKEEILNTNADYSVYLANITNNKTLLSINAHNLLKPASNLKLLVGASVLKALGTRYRYKTLFYIDKYKNLIVKGSGDPSFKSSQLDILIRKLKSKKISYIKNIIAINDYFDDERIGIMWSWDDLTNCYSAQISSLQINQNCLSIILSPQKNNKPVAVKISPYSDYVQIKNEALSKNIPENHLSIQRLRNTNTIIIKGDISVKNKKIKKWITVDKPAKYFLSILQNSLEKNKIKVLGKRQIASEIGYKIKKNLKPFIIINSKYIKYLLRNFLQHSINLYGESFLKTLGYVFFNKGSTYNGRIAIKMLLRNYNLPKKEVFIADGSGLSELNLASANYFAKLLMSIYKDSFYKTFKETLSIAGVSGTLRKTLNIPKLKGRVFAKTGHLKGVIALSGYLETRSYQTIVFSFIFNKIQNNYEIEKLIRNTLLKLSDI